MSTLNEPPFIVTDIFTDIVAAVAAKLGRPVYSYYGSIEEVNTTLMSLNDSPDLYDKKYPLIWLKEPFTISSDLPQIYGKIEEMEMFIITGSQPEYRAAERKENIYKPILYPILAELFNQMEACKAFLGYKAKQNFKVTDRYFWGEAQKSVLNDVCDTIQVRFFGPKIQSNINCKRA